MPDKAIDYPVCKLCGAKHANRDPHVFVDSKKITGINEQTSVTTNVTDDTITKRGFGSGAGRKPIGDKPMTASERKRAERERKKNA